MKRNSIIASIAVLFLVVCLFWLRDEPLNDDARDWLADIPPYNKAYVCLLGLGAAPGEDGCDEGVRLYEQQQELRDVNFPNYFERIDKHELLCSYNDDDCFRKQQEYREDGENLINENKILLQRYRQFLEFPVFAELTPVDPDASFPNYHLLLKASQLQSLVLALEPEPAEVLNKEIRQLRGLLGQRHSLLSKMIVSEMLSHKLRLMALLAQQGRVPMPQPKLLSDWERDMVPAFITEFRFATSTMKELYSGREIDNLTGKLLLKAAFRLNLTLNRCASYFLHYMDMASLPPSQRHPYTLQPPSVWQLLRDPVGSYLMGDAMLTDMNVYIERMDHLDSQLRLFYWLAGSGDAQVGNVWAKENHKPVRTGAKLCFDTPRNTERYSSCLPLLE